MSEYLEKMIQFSKQKRLIHATPSFKKLIDHAVKLEAEVEKMKARIDLADEACAVYSKLYTMTGSEPVFDILKRDCHGQLKYNLIIALGKLMRE